VDDFTRIFQRSDGTTAWGRVGIGAAGAVALVGAGTAIGWLANRRIANAELEAGGQTLASLQSQYDAAVRARDAAQASLAEAQHACADGRVVEDLQTRLRTASANCTVHVRQMIDRVIANRDRYCDLVQEISPLASRSAGIFRTLSLVIQGVQNLPALQRMRTIYPIWMRKEIGPGGSVVEFARTPVTEADVAALATLVRSAWDIDGRRSGYIYDAGQGLRSGSTPFEQLPTIFTESVPVDRYAYVEQWASRVNQIATRSGLAGLSDAQRTDLFTIWHWVQVIELLRSEVDRIGTEVGRRQDEQGRLDAEIASWKQSG